VTIAYVVPFGAAGKQLLAAVAAEAAESGRLIPLEDDGAGGYEPSKASLALLGKLGVSTRRGRNAVTSQPSPIVRFVPAGFSGALQPIMQTVYAYAMGGTMMVNVSALLASGDDGVDFAYKAQLHADDDFCYEVQQAAIALTEAAADLHGERSSADLCVLRPWVKRCDQRMRWVRRDFAGDGGGGAGMMYRRLAQ
jgi:hypothetical protein